MRVFIPAPVTKGSSHETSAAFPPCHHLPAPAGPTRSRAKHPHLPRRCQPGDPRHQYDGSRIRRMGNRQTTDGRSRRKHFAGGPAGPSVGWKLCAERGFHKHSGVRSGRLRRRVRGCAANRLSRTGGPGKGKGAGRGRWPETAHSCGPLHGVRGIMPILPEVHFGGRDPRGSRGLRGRGQVNLRLWRGRRGERSRSDSWTTWISP